jgi:UDP-glucuronate decarboxylase
LAEKIIDITGSTSEIIFKPLPENDPRRRKPDITLAQDKLGWQPNVDIDLGLKKTAEYFDTLLSTKEM